jgi:hypothetical protein
LVAFDAEDGHCDVVTYHHGLTDAPCQNQHGSLLACQPE